MKANTPEKIYLDSYGSGFSHGFHTNKLNDNDIEYIRTDAFIKKVCDYFGSILTEYAGFYVGGEILQHFKDYYMKGK